MPLEYHSTRQAYDAFSPYFEARARRMGLSGEAEYFRLSAAVQEFGSWVGGYAKSPGDHFRSVLLDAIVDAFYRGGQGVYDPIFDEHAIKGISAELLAHTSELARSLFPSHWKEEMIGDMRQDLARWFDNNFAPQTPLQNDARDALSPDPKADRGNASFWALYRKPCSDRIDKFQKPSAARSWLGK